jgi:tubulin beta
LAPSLGIIADEHKLDYDGKYTGSNDKEWKQISVYFSEANGKRYVPRSIMIDLEPVKG